MAGVRPSSNNATASRRTASGDHVTDDARVLLVDENDDLLDGLSAWIAGHPGFQVAGVAHSALEAFDRIGRLEPDIVLMDTSLSDLNALDATHRIASMPGAPIVILMTFHFSAAARAEALSAGASACLSKPDIARDFLGTAGTLWRERQACLAERPAQPASKPRDSASQEDQPSIEE